MHCLECLRRDRVPRLLAAFVGWFDDTEGKVPPLRLGEAEAKADDNSRMKIRC